MTQQVKDACVQYANGLQSITLDCNSTLDEIIKQCSGNSKTAFFDATMMGAGNTAGIRKHEKEIDCAKNRLQKTFKDYFAGKPFSTQDDFDKWHKKLSDDLIKCFPQYNAEREKAIEGRKVGFTYGNAQKFINMSFKNIFAWLVKTNNKCGLPNYQDYFRYCHMPFDTYTLRFVKQKINANLTFLKTSWSTQTNYDVYWDAQKAVIAKIASDNCYAGLTVLEAEFDIFNLKLGI